MRKNETAGLFSCPREPLDWTEPSPEDYLATFQRVPLDISDWCESTLSTEDYLGAEMFDDAQAYEAYFGQRSTGLDISCSPDSIKAFPFQGRLPNQRRPPQISAPPKGLLRRTHQRNLAEIAQALADSGHYRNIDGRLYQFSSPCWRLRLASELESFLPEEVRRMFPEASDYLAMGDYREIFKQLRSRVSKEYMCEIHPDNQHYLCCRDGIYRLSDRRAFPPDPGLNLFYFFNVSAWDIGEVGGHFTEQFLENATNGNVALRERILQMVASIVTALPLKCFFVLEGAGNTGKSQLIKFLQRLLGESACYVLPSINALSERWTVGGLVDKLMCSCPDIPNDHLGPKTISSIKQLVGDDRVRGELKGIDPFDFDCHAKLVCASNHPIKLSHSGQEEAFLNRMVYIPFHNPVPKEAQIPQLFLHLLDEAGYILALAIEARDTLLERNGVFSPLPDGMDETPFSRPTDEQRILAFLEGYCEQDDSAITATGELYEAFCHSQPGIQSAKIERSRFGRLLLTSA